MCLQTGKFIIVVYNTFYVVHSKTVTEIYFHVFLLKFECLEQQNYTLLNGIRRR